MNRRCFKLISLIIKTYKEKSTSISLFDKWDKIDEDGNRVLSDDGKIVVAIELLLVLIFFILAINVGGGL